MLARNLFFIFTSAIRLLAALCKQLILIETHKKFADHCGVPFRLLVDEDAKIAKKFGVWQTKAFMGRKYKGIVRTTFIISEDGKILKIFPKVKVAGHWKEVLESLNL